LLDALCLALFGAVPRLNDTGQAKVPDADGDIPTGDPRTCCVAAPAAAMPRWISSASTAAATARWEANRARDKASGKLQNSRQSLTTWTAINCWPARKRIQNPAGTALGLNFEQFTRAVLLAQSEFSAFLKADDNERSELLEKLTDTALYTRRPSRLRQGQGGRDAHKLLQDQATGVVPLAAEARAELDQQLDAAQQQLKAQQAQLKQLEHTHLAQGTAPIAGPPTQRNRRPAPRPSRVGQPGRATPGPEPPGTPGTAAPPSRARPNCTPCSRRWPRRSRRTSRNRPSCKPARRNCNNSRPRPRPRWRCAATPGRRRTAAAPGLRCANTLARLTEKLGKREAEKQLAETACTEGQAHLNGLLDKQKHVDDACNAWPPN
jgi:exonuclease SbcC